MADDQHGALVAFEPGFQPDQRVQIQVVGGLVEQQQIRWAHQRSGQLQAHAPAARKAVDRVVELADFEAQAEDQRLGAGWCVMRAGVIQIHVGVGHAVAVAAGVGRIDLRLRGLQDHIALNDGAGGALLGLWHVLGDLRHAPLGRDIELAAVFMQRAVQHGKQR